MRLFTSPPISDLKFKHLFLLSILAFAGIAAKSQVLLTATGPANNFNVQYPANLTSVSSGLLVTFFSNQTITGPTTLNLNTLGNKNIYKNVNQPLGPGDILLGQPVTVIFDGSNWQLLSTTATTTLPSTNLWTVSGTNLYPVNLSDHIGIGTSTPGANLDVNGNINIPFVSNGGLYINHSPFLWGDASNDISLGLGSGNPVGTTGYNNTNIGGNTGNANSSGGANTFVGANSGLKNNSGSLNTFIGVASGYNNTIGTNNTFIGVQAGYANVTGNNIISIGFGSNVAADGYYNAIAIGTNAIVGGNNMMVLGGTGANAVNVGIGTSTPQNTLDVVGGVRIENLSSAGINLVQADALGNLGIVTSTSFSLWTLSGTNIQPQNSINSINVVSTAGGYLIGGNLAVQYLPNAQGNSIFLGGAGNNTTAASGSYGNVFAGFQSGANNTTGFDNVFVGNLAGTSNTGGYFNTFVGFVAGQKNATPRYNTFIGAYAGNNNTLGASNTFEGLSAGASNQSGSFNTFHGVYAGNGNLSGSYNSFYGNNAGSTNSSGANNVALGANANMALGTLTNAIAIGYNSAVGASNSLVLGGTGANAVNVGIGLTTPINVLDVNGSLALGAYAGVNTSPANSIIVSGQIGIATPTPTATLDVNGSIAITSTTGKVTHVRSGSNNLVPLAYFFVTGGTSPIISANTNNVTLAGTGNTGKVGTGQYEFNITGENFANLQNYVVLATLSGATGGQIRYATGSFSTASLRINTFTATGAATDYSFSVIIYKP